MTFRRTVLLATDHSDSIIAELAVGKLNVIAYSAYGQQSAQQEVEARLGFNGQLREMQTGWYLLGNGYRAYNPRLMRFHSPDSWSPFGRGGLNAYMYCAGDPVNRSDPTGHIGILTLLSSLADSLMSYTQRGAEALVSATRIAAGRRTVRSVVATTPTEISFASVAPFSRPHGSPPSYFSHDPRTFTYRKLIPNTVGIFDSEAPRYQRIAPRPSVQPPPLLPSYSTVDRSPLIASASSYPPPISTRTNPGDTLTHLQESIRDQPVPNQIDVARPRLRR